MDKIVTVFNSLEAADRAEVEYYARLTPAERLRILLELIARYQESMPDAARGFERVYRIAELS